MTAIETKEDYMIRVLAILFFIATQFLAVGELERSSNDLSVPVYDSLFADYDFIDVDTNRISGDLESFYTKLRDLKGGARSRVSIVHIGDSHLQAGYLSRAFRESIQRGFGNAGRGLIVPHKIAHTNEAPDFRIYSPNRWTADRLIDPSGTELPGIGGLAISSTSDAVRFDIGVVSEASPLDYRFNTVKVFHHPDAPIVVIDSLLITDMSCPDTTLPYMTQINMAEKSESLNLYAVKSGTYNRPLFYGFSLENGQPGVLYHAIGTNGACHQHYTRNPQVIAQTAALDPDLVIVSLGSNEAAGRNFIDEVYYKELDALVGQIKAVNPDASILITTPIGFFRRRGRGFSVNTNVARVRDVIVRYCKDKGVAYWDPFQISGAEESANNWFKAGFMQRDRIHFTQEAYKIQGELMYNAIAKGYMNPSGGR